LIHRNCGMSEFGVRVERFAFMISQWIEHQTCSQSSGFVLGSTLQCCSCVWVCLGIFTCVIQLILIWTYTRIQELCIHICICNGQCRFVHTSSVLHMCSRYVLSERTDCKRFCFQARVDKYSVCYPRDYILCLILSCGYVSAYGLHQCTYICRRNDLTTSLFGLQVTNYTSTVFVYVWVCSKLRHGNMCAGLASAWKRLGFWNMCYMKCADKRQP